MGTTATAAMLDGREADLMHVGDSRGYLSRGARCCQLTDDHSVVAEMVRQGQLLPEEAERHSHATSSRGRSAPNPTSRSTRFASAVRRRHAVAVQRRAVVAGARCRDGTDRSRRRPTCADAVEHLVTAALEQGGNDNITVVLARFDGSADPAGRRHR